MDTENKSNWLTALIRSINSLSEQFGLDDQSTSTLRDFIVDIAREQYKIGNRSGIRWARQNPSPAQN